jgi:3D (Asp-Asp-Asp) domain-containing protein
MTWPLAARKEVADRSGRCSFAPVMTFTGEGLVLGGAILAPPHRDRGGTPEIAIDGTEERILALLAVAYRKTTGPGVLGNIRRAARYWRRGENDLAAIEIALSGLPPLEDEKAASTRLLLGEQLLAEGLSPRELIKTCGLDPASLDNLKAGYNSDQQRVPTGSPDGGQWTSEGGETLPVAAGEGAGSSTPPGGQPSSVAGGAAAQPRTTLHGYATVYTERLKGHPTATGEIYDPNKMTAAVLPETIPLKSVVTVTLDSDQTRSVDVRVNDHGLYQRIRNPDGTVANRPLPGRVIDLSSAAFKALTGTASGKVMVTVTMKSDPR